LVSRHRRYFGLFLCITLAFGSTCEHVQAFPFHCPWHRPKLLVGYLDNSSFYSPTPFYVKDLVTNGSAARLNQINYASASVKDGRCSLSDPTADLETAYTAKNSVDGKPDDPAAGFRGYFHQLEELKQRYPRLRILISLEGRASDFAIDAQPENRAAFVRSCVDLYLRGDFGNGINKPGLFDGIDVDWETPHEEDAANYYALIAEFRSQMNAVRRDLTLSIAVNESPAAFVGTNFAAVAPLVDQVGVMNYDYAGPWNKTTGFVAPLFAGPPESGYDASVRKSIASYKAAGVTAHKLLMGLPFYGYGWAEVEDSNNGLFQSGRAMHSERPYRRIRKIASSSQVFRDSQSQAPWLFDGNEFWTYEDPVSVQYKVSYAAHQGVGGVMIWELSGDTVDAELLKSAYDALRDPLQKNVFQQSPDQPPATTSDTGQ
jgi:chitinase